jgi:hypothetical protein
MKYYRCIDCEDNSYKTCGYNSFGKTVLKKELLDYIKDGCVDDFNYVLNKPNVNSYLLTDLLQMLNWSAECSDAPFDEDISNFL